MDNLQYQFIQISLLIVFLAISILSLPRFKLICERQIDYYFLPFTIGILFLIVVFRYGPFLPDYNAYVLFFETYRNSGGEGLSRIVAVEKSFLHISNVVIRLFHGDVFFLFFIYAIIGVIFKIIAINIFSHEIRQSLLVYISFFYILHDFIQIRIGAAASFILFAIYFKTQKKYIWCLVAYLLSIYFHYSAIAYGVILFFDTRRINVHFYFTFIVVSYIISMIDINILSIFSRLDLGVLSEKIILYSRSTKYLRGSVITMPKLIRLLFAFIIFLKINILNKDENSIIFIKMYFLSIGVQQLFNSIPVLPTRLSELFRISEIFVLPMLGKCFKEKNIFNVMLVFYCLYIFLFTIISYNIV
jgi:hypothetical protein